MYTSTILATAFAVLAAAAPHPRDTYYGVSLSLRVSSPINDGSNPGTYEPAPVEINKLTALGGADGVGVSEIKFDGVASNVDINQIECRAYRDAAGVQPGSAAFTNKKPAEVSTNLSTVRSVLCYVVTQYEE